MYNDYLLTSHPRSSIVFTENLEICRKNRD